MSANSAPDSHSSYDSRRKLPIYDEPSPDVIFVKTELPLQPQVRWARENLQSLKADLDHRFNFALDHGLKVERKIVGTLSSLIDQKESTSSAVLSVGIGTMTGSILARNRSFPLRFLSPLTFFLISSNHFLPTTTHNFKSYLFKLQDHHFPRSAATRDEIIRRGVEGVQYLNHLKHQMLSKTTEIVKDSTEALEKYGGLNISHEPSKGKK